MRIHTRWARGFHGYFLVAIFCAFSLLSGVVYAQDVHIDAERLAPHTSISFSPKSGSFVEGSTFDVPILLDTQGSSINAIELHVIFDVDKLMVINPSSGKSIIGVWTEPPAYDNTRGTASYVGVIPNGIKTGSGLIGTITFKAKSIGGASVRVRSDSNVLLNDGLGSDTIVDFGRAQYDIIVKAPEGVRIYSDTHPLQDHWYNNNSPILSWDKDTGVTGFSYILDDKPSTVPENTVMTPDTSKSYENIGDGVWYFHVKAQKAGQWGTTGTFQLHIDTAPPAVFTPRIDYILAAAALVERALISFVTTDSLSGLDHYEVGVIDKSQPVSAAPAFVETESPYQVPLSGTAGSRVIVRAIDHAGNVRDASLDVGAPPLPISAFVSKYLSWILALIILIMILTLILHYFIGHHVIRHFRRAMALVRKEELEEELRHESMYQGSGDLPHENMAPPTTVMSPPSAIHTIKDDILK